MGVKKTELPADVKMDLKAFYAEHKSIGEI